MKTMSIPALVLAVALTACSSVAMPTQATVMQPTSVPPTAEVIVVTVEVPVEVTSQPSAAPATPVPTETQPPTAVPTEVVPTEAPAEAAPLDAGPAGSSAPVDASLWGGYFKDISYSNPSFSLRCPPKEITFTATATDSHITAVDLYYRIEDRKGTTISEWKNIGRMPPAGNGTFSLTLSGESIHPDLRKALAWFDFQLVGLNKVGQVVGRTEKVVQLVTYTIDCQ